MKLLSFTLVLAACHSAPNAPVAHHAEGPKKLSPSVTRAEMAGLKPVDAQRVEDGPQAMPTRETPLVTVEGNIISALACRPNGSMPSLVTDSRYVYVTFFESKLGMPTHPDGNVPMATPSTYCSYQRFVIPDGLELGGQLTAR